MGLVGPLVGGIVGGLGVTSASVASALWQRDTFVQTVANMRDLMSVLQSLASIYHALIHVTLYLYLTLAFMKILNQLSPMVTHQFHKLVQSNNPTLCTIL